MALRFKSLQVLRETIDMGSMSKAASRLRIAQPQVSRLIGDLERHFATPLLDRHSKGVAPTQAGLILAKLARRTDSEIETALSEISSAAGEVCGTVTLGLPGSLAGALIPSLLDRLRQSHPRVKLSVVDGFSAELHRRTLEGRLDLALLYAQQADRAFIQEQLLDEPLGLVSRKPARTRQAGRNTVRLAELAERALILPGAPNRLRLLVDRAAEDGGVTLDIVSQVDSFTALTKLCRQGQIETILPQSAVSGEADSDELEWRMIIPPIRRQIALARLPGRPETDAMRVVADALRSLCSEIRSAPAPDRPTEFVRPKR